MQQHRMSIGEVVARRRVSPALLPSPKTPGSDQQSPVGGGHRQYLRDALRRIVLHPRAAQLLGLRCSDTAAAAQRYLMAVRRPKLTGRASAGSVVARRADRRAGNDCASSLTAVSVAAACR